MSKKRYLSQPSLDGGTLVIVERKYGYEWREVGRYASVDAALAEHPTARNRNSEKWMARRSA